MVEQCGPSQHNAHVAGAAGHTGDGVTIAVVDSGIDVDSPEFAGRLSASSTDLCSTRNSVNSTDDHGTNVAQIVYEMAPGAQMYLAKINTDVQLQQAMSDMAAAGQGLSGQVSVGMAPGTAAATLALPLLRRVRARHPGTRHWPHQAGQHDRQEAAIP